MMKRPLLSIVTCTRGNFTSYWFDQIRKVKGDIEVILVYPPGGDIDIEVKDPRIKTLRSLLKGEVPQRFLGLLNARGKYVMALDDDDFFHPDGANTLEDYFQRFPDSWMLRLRKEIIYIDDRKNIERKWDAFPDLRTLKVVEKDRFSRNEGMIEIPIAPLNKNFDMKVLVGRERRDMHGIYMENFTNRIWKSEIVHNALEDFQKKMTVFGAVKYIPSWNLDRALALYIQAKFFKENTVIGHWLPEPAQVRFTWRHSEAKERRFYIATDLFLLRRFPQYGYFWTLCVSQLIYIPIRLARFIKRRVASKFSGK